MKISVVTTVYNTSQFIDKCILSVLSQDYSNFEMLVVDDGSVDDSPRKISEWSRHDKRIKPIRLNKNFGLSYARNVGLNAAKGDLIFFLDSDDFISPQTFYHSIGLFKRYTDIDMLIIPCDLVDTNGHYIISYFSYSTIQFHWYNKYQAEALFCGIPFQACGRFFKKKIFNNLRFPINKIYEDTWIVPNVAESTRLIVTSHVGRYFYTQREGSITTSPLSLKKFTNRLEPVRSEMNYSISQTCANIRKNTYTLEFNFILMMHKEARRAQLSKMYLFALLKFYLTGSYSHLSRLHVFILIKKHAIKYLKIKLLKLHK